LKGTGIELFLRKERKGVIEKKERGVETEKKTVYAGKKDRTEKWLARKKSEREKANQIKESRDPRQQRNEGGGKLFSYFVP